MVFFFTSNVVNPPVLIYMGKDKHENEDLIKYGWPEDVWFHVDKLSSAHVYLRLPLGWNWENIPEDLLQDCAQLCKANSIEGNKKDNITIVYTPWSNLKKTPGMETGQVTFHKEKLVKKVFVTTRQNVIVNRLNKTKQEKYPDLNAERVERMRVEKHAERETQRQRKAEELKLAEERKKLADMKSYKDVFNKLENGKVSSANEDLLHEAASKGDFTAYEEDFM